jgi:uncharacterized protein YjdB
MRTIPRQVRLVLLGLACLTAAGCPNGCSEITKILNPSGVQSVAISPTVLQLAVGQTQQFTATVRPDGASDKGVTWSVAPAGIATIDDKGLLTALAPGQVTVIAATVATPVHRAESVVNVIAASAQ